jgi:RimJ/RimL family protein N-acetyltransferase
MIYQLNEEYFVRPLREDDVDGPYRSWFEDQEICGFNSHGKFFKSRQWFLDYISSINEEDKVVWAICHRVDGHVGNVSLQEISSINRNAEFAILLGDRRHLGKGLSKLAGRKLLEHGFQKLNLVRIYCGTADTSVPMKALAQALGMVEEGRRRKHLFLSGEWVDLVEFGVLRDSPGMP